MGKHPDRTVAQAEGSEWLGLFDGLQNPTACYTCTPCWSAPADVGTAGCLFWRAGLQLHLASLRRTAPEQLASGPTYEGNVIVHPSAKIGKDCKIGPNVSIGIGCELENGVRVSNAVLLHRVKVP